MRQAIFSSFRRAWADREPILLLAGIVLCFNLLLFAPVRGILVELEAVEPDRLSAYLADHESSLSYILIIALVFSFFVSGAQAVLARLAETTQPPVFADGAGRFMMRTIHVYWRGLCATGWMLLLVLPVAMVAGSFGGSAALAITYLAVLIVLFPTMAALGYSVSAAANDQALPIRAAFVALGVHRLRYIGLVFVLFVSAQILTSIINAFVGAFGLFDASPFAARAVVTGANLLFIFFAFSVWLGVASQIRNDITTGLDVRV